MKKISVILMMIISTILMVGCGMKVEVPAASVGKVMGKHGYQEGTITTSKFRLAPCFAYCDKLVLLDVSDMAAVEPMELFMPEDRLIMNFELRMTLTPSPKSYDELFNRVPPSTGDRGDRVAHISLDRAYEIYARQIIRAEAREFLSQYKISEIVSSREAINNELSDKLKASIVAKTPFTVLYVGLADVKYPPVIVTAQENAAERREMIQQEEAQLEISKVQLERELQEQKLQRTIDVEKAEAEAQVNKILAESVTPEYIRYRELNALETIAKSDNKVFVPASMLDTMAGQVQVGNQ